MSILKLQLSDEEAGRILQKFNEKYLEDKDIQDYSGDFFDNQPLSISDNGNEQKNPTANKKFQEEIDTLYETWAIVGINSQLNLNMFLHLETAGEDRNKLIKTLIGKK